MVLAKIETINQPVRTLTEKPGCLLPGLYRWEEEATVKPAPPTDMCCWAPGLPRNCSRQRTWFSWKYTILDLAFSTKYWQRWIKYIWNNWCWESLLASPATWQSGWFWIPADIILELSRRVGVISTALHISLSNYSPWDDETRHFLLLTTFKISYWTQRNATHSSIQLTLAFFSEKATLLNLV